jgi:hypothetical protein
VSLRSGNPPIDVGIAHRFLRRVYGHADQIATLTQGSRRGLRRFAIPDVIAAMPALLRAKWPLPGESVQHPVTIATRAAAAGPNIGLRQILESDIPAVARLLARGFQDRTEGFWHGFLDCLERRDTPAGLPKFGYLLEADGAVVGALLLIFSRPRGDDGIRCNVSSWYVEQKYRSYASLMVAKALRDKDVTYVNVTPSPHTLPIVQAQGYTQYSRGTFVAAPLLQPGRGQGKIVTAGGRAPTGACRSDQKILAEHAKFGCIGFWCETAERAYPFVFRPRLVKGVVPCAQLVYCDGLDSFVRFAGPIGRFLAGRGRPVILIDSNGAIPGVVGTYLDGKMPKFFKGPDRPRLGDLAYTEVAMFGV